MDLVDNSNKNKKVKVEDTAVGTQLDTNQLDPEDTAQDAVFQDIDAEHMPTEIESLCMRCHENGTTTLLLTNIPHFKQVVLMAFECPHCLYKNNQVQSCAAVGDMGVRQTLKITTSADLSRQVVKSESCTARFVELDFEIPADTQSGILSTVEGLVSRAIEGLQQDQPLRLIQHPDLHAQLETVISVLELYAKGTPFTLVIDDPSGNSYIENPNAPLGDPRLTTVHYKRSEEQTEQLGLEQELPLNEQVHCFPGNCSRCNYPCETKMHMLDIPHFKEVIIMSTVCDSCGYKSNEVKAGGAVAAKGQRIILKMVDAEDLNRDILKSETCGLSIPEIELELTMGTLGGRFTTVEGLISQVKDELGSKTSFSSGDTSTALQKVNFQSFMNKLDSVLRMDREYTLILDDPLANSHLQNLYAPDADPNMTIENYERDWDQNEAFGLNDIKVDDY